MSVNSGTLWVSSREGQQHLFWKHERSTNVFSIDQWIFPSSLQTPPPYVSAFFSCVFASLLKYKWPVLSNLLHSTLFRPDWIAFSDLVDLGHEWIMCKCKPKLCNISLRFKVFTWQLFTIFHQGSSDLDFMSFPSAHFISRANSQIHLLFRKKHCLFFSFSLSDPDPRWMYKW